MTVDVVATDSHGNVVRDLKPEEFEVSDGGRQGIAQFSFVDKSPKAGSARIVSGVRVRPIGFYTNQEGFERLREPPTVVLLDGLNTEGADLMQARRDMLRMLSTLPERSRGCMSAGAIAGCGAGLCDQSQAIARSFG